NRLGRSSTSVPDCRSARRPSAVKSSCSKRASSVWTSSRNRSSTVESSTATRGAASSSWETVGYETANRTSDASAATWSIARGRRREDLSEAIRLQLSNDAGLLHGFDHPCRAVVTDLQASLDSRDRGLARFRHDPYRLIVKGILLAVQRAAAFPVEARSAVAGRPFEHLVDVHGLAPGAQRPNDR